MYVCAISGWIRYPSDIWSSIIFSYCPTTKTCHWICAISVYCAFQITSKNKGSVEEIHMHHAPPGKKSSQVLIQRGLSNQLELYRASSRPFKKLCKHYTCPQTIYSSKLKKQPDLRAVRVFSALAELKGGGCFVSVLDLGPKMPFLYRTESHWDTPGNEPRKTAYWL